MDRQSKTSNAVAIVHGYFDAWNRHDLEALLALFGERGTFLDPTLPNPVGVDEMRRLFTDTLQSSMPDISFEVLNVIGNDDDVVAAEWRMRGTSGGHAVTVPGTDFFQIEGAMIREARAYFDLKGMMQQIGQS